MGEREEERERERERERESPDPIYPAYISYSVYFPPARFRGASYEAR